MPRCLADCVAMAHRLVCSEAQGDTQCGLRLVCRIMLSHLVVAGTRTTLVRYVVGSPASCSLPRIMDFVHNQAPPNGSGGEGIGVRDLPILVEDG